MLLHKSLNRLNAKVLHWQRDKHFGYRTFCTDFNTFTISLSVSITIIIASIIYGIFAKIQCRKRVKIKNKKIERAHFPIFDAITTIHIVYS